MNTESFTLEDLQRRAEQCRNCDLAAARTHLVFGTGSPTAKIVLVGEGPGEQEDRKASGYYAGNHSFGSKQGLYLQYRQMPSSA